MIAGAVAIVALLLAVGVGFGGGLFGGSSGGSPSPAAAGPSQAPAPSGTAASPDASPGATPSPGASGDGPSPSPSGEPPVAVIETDVAIAPVTSFRSPATRSARSDVVAAAEGSGPYRGLVLVEEDADAILASLELDRADVGDRLTTVEDAEALAADLADHRRRLGFLRADDVDTAVHALGWGNRSLFGVDRVKSLDRWPLTARLLGPETPAYDPGAAWTLVAGGDILLDRGVKLALDANGADFPFEGGTVEITGRCPDCSPFGWDLPYTDRTGNAGVVRDLLQGADLAIANFENPAPNNPTWHASGTVFNADPDHIDSLVDAGLDWVSLANNHIGDAGRTGMLQTMRNLDKRGLAHGGLGRNLDKAHEAALLEVGDVTVGLLGYDMIAPGYHAGEDLAGSAGMSKKALKRDIRRARAAGADVVVVFPHWGDRVPGQPLRHPAAAGPGRDRRGGGPRGRRPPALGGGHGGLQGQADLVLAGQLRVRPDLVRVHDGGPDPRAHVQRRRAGPGADPSAPDPGQGAAEPDGPRRDGRQVRDGPGLGRLGGPARLVAGAPVATGRRSRRR